MFIIGVFVTLGVEDGGLRGGGVGRRVYGVCISGGVRIIVRSFGDLVFLDLGGF